MVIEIVDLKMVIFHSYVNVYQRVNGDCSEYTTKNWCQKIGVNTQGENVALFESHSGHHKILPTTLVPHLWDMVPSQ